MQSHILPERSRRAESARRPRAADQLSVPREGIRFHNVAHERVQIEIAVVNHGRRHSAPTQMRIDAALLGAFVRWQPLVELPVPSIEPGGAAIVRTVARQPRPGAIPGFLLPPGLLNAARERDRLRPTSEGALWARMLLLGLRGRRSGRGELPPSLLDLLGDAQPHWAGNLDVWVANKPVERHRAPGLRITPGRSNLTHFCVGDGPDEYAFRMEGLGEDWPWALHDLSAGRPLVPDDTAGAPLWHATKSLSSILFVVRPPLDCTSACARIHVTQRSSGKTALVEFDLDPAAAGPGCPQA